MTDPELADATYIEPITPEIVAKIIEKERPDAVLPTMGGQTALNTALALFKDGTLDRLRRRADRRQCRGDREGRGPAEVPRGDGPDRARKPALGDRPQRRGGAGGARDASGCRRSSGRASRSAAPAAASPTTATSSRRSSAAGSRPAPTTEVLIEESVLGWKEYEMEVVRDRADNAIIICSIENVDPMGVHTGDSITVAPALTLTDKEYQIMRTASIAVLREIGVETGGSNVQFAVNPKDGRMVVIEMNPRVSRSLGAGVQGDRLPDRQGRGQAGGRLHARRDRQRHHRRRDPGELRADDRLCRHQDPALRVREVQGRRGAAVDRDEVGRRGDGDRPQLRRKPAEGAARAGDRADRPRPRARARRRRPATRSRRRWRGRRPTGCWSPPRRCARASPSARSTRSPASTPGSSSGSRRSSRPRRRFGRNGLPSDADGHAAAEGDGLFRRAARQLALRSAACRARLAKTRRARLGPAPRRGQGDDRRDHRGRGARAAPQLGVRPVFKRIDTCAAEFEAKTPYMYSTYEAPSFGEPEDEAEPSATGRKVVILGGGPNRIGQGIEFDYCCCHAAYALGRDGAGLRDDHDQLQPGDGLDRLRHLGPALFRAADGRGRARDPPRRAAHGELLGVIVQFGGQTPLKLAAGAAGGGHPDPRHLARRDRPRRGPRALRQSWSTSSASGSPRTASPAAATRRSRSPSGSAIRC